MDDMVDMCIVKSIRKGPRMLAVRDVRKQASQTNSFELQHARDYCIALLHEPRKTRFRGRECFFAPSKFEADTLVVAHEQCNLVPIYEKPADGVVARLGNTHTSHANAEIEHRPPPPTATYAPSGQCLNERDAMIAVYGVHAFDGRNR